VVVFSSKGKRPDASKMSCGDLDGDIYLVIWDQIIVQSVPKFRIRSAAPLQGNLDLDVEEFKESDKV
jgi:RNA-dependent RNA polymerase